jgi:hypothetical protein
MIYRICYTKAMREKLKLASSFDYLCDLDIVAEYDEITNEVLEYERITDRESALTYITNHKEQFQGIGDGGYTGQIYGLCIECTEGDRPTALLYEHEVFGLIWVKIG